MHAVMATCTCSEKPSRGLPGTAGLSTDVESSQMWQHEAAPTAASMRQLGTRSFATSSVECSASRKGSCLWPVSTHPAVVPGPKQRHTVREP